MIVETLIEVINSEHNLIVYLAARPNNYRIISYLIKQVSEFCHYKEILTLLKNCIHTASVSRQLSNLVKLYDEWGKIIPPDAVPPIVKLKEMDYPLLVPEAKFRAYFYLVETNKLHDSVRKYGKITEPKELATFTTEIEERQKAVILLLNQYHKTYIEKTKDSIRQRQYYDEIIEVIKRSNVNFQLMDIFYSSHRQLFKLADLDKISSLPYFSENNLQEMSASSPAIGFVERLTYSSSLTFNHFSVEIFQKLHQIMVRGKHDPEQFTNHFRNALIALLSSLLPFPTVLILLIVNEYFLYVPKLESMWPNFLQSMEQKEKITLGIQIHFSKIRASSGYLALFKAFAILESLFSASSILVANDEFKKFQAEIGKNMGMGPEQIEYPELTDLDLDSIVKRLVANQISFTHFKDISNYMFELQENLGVVPFTFFSSNSIDKKNDDIYIRIKQTPLLIELIINLQKLYKLIMSRKRGLHCFFICIHGYLYPQLLSFSNGNFVFSRPGLCNILSEIKYEKLTADQKEITNALSNLLTNSPVSLAIEVAEMVFPDMIKELKVIVNRSDLTQLEEVTTEKVYRYYELAHQFFTLYSGDTVMKHYREPAIHLKTIASQLRSIDPEKFTKLYQQMLDVCKNINPSLLENINQTMVPLFSSSLNVGDGSNDNMLGR